MENTIQTWKSLGRIFNPEKTFGYAAYGAVPIARQLDNHIFRFYFSIRDRKNRATGYFIDFDMEAMQIIHLSDKPVLQPGELGCFDDSGAMASCLLRVDKDLVLYYMGWNLGVTVPFRIALGMAVSTDNGATFIKKFAGPVMERNAMEPHFVSSCDILLENGLFRMWYLSGVKWEQQGDTVKHHYHIKYAESKDGINWKRNSQVAIDFKYPNEYAISVPRVIKENGTYKMWYSYRGSPWSDFYRIGYAESADGLQWMRKDEVITFEQSQEGWDADMVCYPFIFDYNHNRYMLYNGNGYGQTGFGLAILDK